MFIELITDRKEALLVNTQTIRYFQPGSIPETCSVLLQDSPHPINLDMSLAELKRQLHLEGLLV
jgi:hypothetical protein